MPQKKHSVLQTFLLPFIGRKFLSLLQVGQRTFSWFILSGAGGWIPTSEPASEATSSHLLATLKDAVKFVPVPIPPMQVLVLHLIYLPLGLFFPRFVKERSSFTRTKAKLSCCFAKQKSCSAGDRIRTYEGAKPPEPKSGPLDRAWVPLQELIICLKTYLSLLFY